MLKLIVSFDIPGLADSVHRVRAKGFLAASLWWADADGALADWSAFAYIPIAPSGEGAFRFCGRRAVPPGASHVLVRAVRPDLCVWEGALVPLPPGYAGIREESRKCRKLCIMSDLHLTKDAGRLKRALRRAADSDALLLTGDLVNDGLPEQYRLLRSCLEELPAGLPVFAVNGNHGSAACASARNRTGRGVSGLFTVAWQESRRPGTSVEPGWQRRVFCQAGIGGNHWPERGEPLARVYLSGRETASLSGGQA